ncbi:MAG: hypothetical protein DRQ88_01850 [Epsilonproteobacteria bacterium]|nr:MAG: hypothetical protein DRQ89_08615 [Campylobacterota bacterium]RLA67820.1 MAG: hypothetical protein DRQ88_01850 [Campylobacterota bacterium]
MKWIFKALQVFLFSSFLTLAQAADFWLPATVFVTPGGNLSHTLPFPVTSGGPAVDASDLGHGFFPTVGGNYTKFKRVFAVGNKEIKDQNFAPGERGVLLPAKSSQGYRVIEQSDKSLTLGLNWTGFMAGWSILNVAVGITGSYSKGVSVSRWAPNFAATKKLPKIEIPVDKKILLKEWHPGDSLSTTRTLGVTFMAAGGAGPFALGLAGTINSTWEVNIERPENSPQNKPIAVITYTKSKGKGFNVSATAFLGGISLDKFWGKSKSFTYSFDLSNKKIAKKLLVKTESKRKKKIETSFINVSVEKAYQHALEGNFVFADQMIKLRGFGIKKIQEMDSKSKSTTKNAFFSVPILINANYSVGKTYTINNSRMLAENTVGEEFVSIYNKESSTAGVLSRDSQRTNMFKANFQQVTNLKKGLGERIRRYSANYKYLYMRNKVDADKLQEELKKVRYKIGNMKALKNLKIPKEDIGSLKIEMDITLSDLATDEMIRHARNTTEGQFVSEATDYLKGFFANVKDAKEEICRNAKMRILKECIYTTKRQTISAMKKAYKALNSMWRHRKEQNFKNFVEAYASFGEGFIENRFTLKTMLRVLKYRKKTTGSQKGQRRVDKYVKDKKGRRTKIPFQVTFQIQGSNLAPFKQLLYTYK